mgnify:CR=1 FL=1
MRIFVAYRGIDNIAGGVERISISLMNDMVRRGHDITFFTLDKADATSFYPMDEKIAWHKADIGDYRLKASLTERFKRILVIRKLLKSTKPDVILAFQDGAFLQLRVASLGMRIPVVLAERIAPSHFQHRQKNRNQSIAFFLYRFADKITVQSQSYVPYYPKKLQTKITVIPNPVELPSVQARPAGVPGQTKTLLCVGRITHQKNQAVLVKAFANLQGQFPDWRLVLAGAEDDPSVRALAARAGLQDKVVFMGAVKDVAALYAESHLFCLPSRWEGFPNALAEALSYGLPGVGFAGCDGVNVLIHHLENGLLATGNDNLQTLQAMLAAAMEDDNARAAMGTKAIQSVRSYQPRAIFDQWEKFLKAARDHETPLRD